MKSTVLTLFLLIVSHTNSKTIRTYSQQRVVVISFDGFRYDYIDREDLKAFKRFAREGVKSSSMKPVFATKTFPNHHTMATGLYEENHGIMSNQMYDPVYSEHFDKSSKSKWWNTTKPIWMLNEDRVIEGTANKTGKSATIFWPGSDVSYDNRYPFFTIKNYTHSYTTRHRFDKVVDLLLQHSDLNLVMCYMEQPDDTAHHFGPDHQKTKEMLKNLDNDLDYFLKKMDRARLLDKVNIILVSDHGFTSVHKNNIIYLTDYLTDPNDYYLDSHGVLVQIRPKDGKKEKVYDALKKASNLNVFYKQDIPERWHYKNNRRVPEIFAVARLHYYVAIERATKNKSVWLPAGDHGYDNEEQEMHGIFLARGPAFKKNLKIGEVQIVDVCPLLCHLLNIPLHQSNGSLSRLENIIQESNLFSVIMRNPALIIALLSICGIFVLIIILGCTISCYRNFVESAKYRQLNDDNVPLTSWHDDDDDLEVTEFQMRKK